MKICFVTEDFYPDFIGGQGIYGYNLCLELSKLGHKVTVLAETRRNRTKFWQKNPINVLLVPFVFGNQVLLALLEYIAFKTSLSKQHFDILHANQISGLFFILFRPKNISRIVVSAHNTNYDMAQRTNSEIKWFLYQPLIWLEKIVYEKADALLFNSPSEQRDLLNYYNIKSKESKIVYLGTTIPKITKNEKAKAKKKIYESLNLNPRTKIVLYIGRLVKRKRVDSLLQSLSRLDKNNIFGLIIGDGRERELLIKEAPKNSLFLGFIDNTRPYLLAADCFVTVSEAEGGFLLSALEAASFGLPLILSPSAAGFPIVSEGQTGYVIEPDNIQGLTKAIKKVVRDSKAMGKKSRQLALLFSWRQTALNTLKFYSKLLS